MNATINTMPETDNGSHQVPGMCYVPWQTFGKTYDPMRGLAAGTIFPELDKPFTGKCNMNMILRTLATKESKINFIKAITVLIMNSAIYFSIVLIYSAFIWSVFGLEGWNMKIQTSYLFWLSPLNINYFQAYVVNVLIGYLAVLVVTFFTSLLVKINEKKYIGELLSILFIFIPFMFNNYSFFCFFPSNVIQLSRNILNFSWINGINSIYLEFIALLCVAILLFFLVCRKNRKEI